MATEQLRISRVLDSARQCNASIALAKAQALYGTLPCTPGVCFPASKGQVQSSSQYLNGKMASCTQVVRFGAVPESVRIARMITRVQQEETNPTNPTTRFKEYSRVFPVQCPPIDPVIANGSEPKASTRCQLPNNPLNPVLPA